MTIGFFQSVISLFKHEVEENKSTIVTEHRMLRGSLSLSALSHGCFRRLFKLFLERSWVDMEVPNTWSEHMEIHRVILILFDS